MCRERERKYDVGEKRRRLKGKERKQEVREQRLVPLVERKRDRKEHNGKWYSIIPDGYRGICLSLSFSLFEECCYEIILRYLTVAPLFSPFLLSYRVTTVIGK